MDPHPILTDRRRANRDANIAEFEQRSTWLATRPLALFVELTQNCNLACPSCRSATKYRADWNMSPEVFDRAAELFDTALLVDLRGWGESVMLKTFPAAVDRVLDAGARLRVVTNGQVDRPPVWDRMMAADSLVVLSCDGASPELFATLRAGGTLERLERTARSVTSLRDEHGASREAVSLYTVVSRPNLHELPGIVGLADRLGVRHVTFGPIQIGDDHPWSLTHDVDATRRALDAATDAARAAGVTLQLASSLDASLNLGDDVKSMCMHPWSYAYISHEGRVGFCDHLIGQPAFTFGSLLETPFDDIWNAPGFERLRASHAAAAIPDEFSPCRWCYKRRYVDFEHVTHPSYAAKLVTSETRARLWAHQQPACGGGASFLGDHQVVTEASRTLLPLAVVGRGAPT